MTDQQQQLQMQLQQPPITRVFCWGSKAGGALGHNATAQRGLERYPIPASCLPLDIKSPPSFVSAGYRTSMVVLDDGRCYSWGERLGGGGQQCGVNAVDQRTSRLLRIQGKIAIVDVKHGNNHACAVTADGTMWSWGDASEGRLGLGNDKRRGIITMPKKVLFVERMKKYQQIGCGERHTIACIEDGSMVAFGANDASQLGIGKEKKKIKMSWEGVKVLCSEKIVLVACGTNHSAAVSDGGILFTWGWGENGRLGHGDTETRSRPERVDSLAHGCQTITKVSCGSSHTCVVSEEGDVLGFGWNMYGQVGIQEDPTKDDDEIGISCLRPAMCLRGNMVMDVSCGFAHTAATTVSGKLYTWGFNEEGQLGLGHERNVNQPSIVDFRQEKCTKYVLSVSC
eukprot:12006342-Ditylum_brightwellii.AAC.1